MKDRNIHLLCLYFQNGSNLRIKILPRNIFQELHKYLLSLYRNTNFKHSQHLFSQFFIISLISIRIRRFLFGTFFYYFTQNIIYRIRITYKSSHLQRTASCEAHLLQQLPLISINPLKLQKCTHVVVEIEICPIHKAYVIITRNGDKIRSKIAPIFLRDDLQNLNNNTRH